MEKEINIIAPEGYEIDKDIMREHAHSILAYYVGDGCYRDGHKY